MKRRNFFGSLFAAGAVATGDLAGTSDSAMPVNGGEVVTPINKMPQLVAQISGRDLIMILEHNRINRKRF